MELTPAQLAALQTLTVSSGKMRTDNLSVGQQLLAKVIALNSTSGEVTLNINNALLNAKTTLPLKIDQTLQLLVAQTGKQITLKLPDKVISSLVTEQAMRQVLPQQKPIGVAVQHIQDVIKQAKPLQISPRLVQIANDFIRQLPTTKQLSTPEGVKTAIKNSGLLLEKNLKTIIGNTTTQTIKKDLKSLLMNLKNALVKEKQANEPTSSTQKNTQLAQANKLQPQQVQIKAIVAPQIKASTTQNRAPLSPPTTAQKAAEAIKQIKLQTSLTLTKDAENKIKSNSATAPIKTVNDAKQFAKNEQIQQAVKIINQKQKAIPKTLNSSTITKPLPLLQTQQTILQSPQQNKLTPSYNTEQNSVKHALDFIATKTVAKQSSPATRITNLVDMIDNLIKSVDSAISRTQLHQLNTLQEQDNGKLAWSLEIPAQDEEDLHLIQMQFEKEQAQDKDGEAVVTVNLAIELESLGPVHARITLISDKIGVVLWAEQDNTYELTRQNVAELQENLQKSGFKSESIACHQGKPPQSRGTETVNSNNLVDLKA